MILASIRYNLANLFRFSGRDGRGTFWPYAIAVFLTSMAVDILLFIPVMTDMMQRMMIYLRDHPEGFPQPAPGQIQALPPGLMPDMSRMFVPTTIVSVVSLLLLAAAVVRRLHDRDRSGLVGGAAAALPGGRPCRRSGDDEGDDRLSVQAVAAHDMDQPQQLVLLVRFHRADRDARR